VNDSDIAIISFTIVHYRSQRAAQRSVAIVEIVMKTEVRHFSKVLVCFDLVYECQNFIELT